MPFHTIAKATEKKKAASITAFSIADPPNNKIQDSNCPPLILFFGHSGQVGAGEEPYFGAGGERIQAGARVFPRIACGEKLREEKSGTHRKTRISTGPL
jgi:hypothetical protein